MACAVAPSTTPDPGSGKFDTKWNILCAKTHIDGSVSHPFYPKVPKNPRLSPPYLLGTLVNPQDISYAKAHIGSLWSPWEPGSPIEPGKHRINRTPALRQGAVSAASVTGGSRGARRRQSSRPGSGPPCACARRGRRRGCGRRAWGHGRRPRGTSSRRRA